MKELNVAKTKLEEFDVEVRKYLSYAEIQAIVQTTLKLESWAERQTNIDMLVLAYCTDISMEKLQEIGHEMLVESGLVEAVLRNIRNYYQIKKAISYEEGTVKVLNNIVKTLPKYQKELEKVIKHGKPDKK